MIYLYCSQITNRTLYIASYLEHSLGLEVRSVTQATLAISDTSIILNHSNTALDVDHISIYDSGLLRQSTISAVDLRMKLDGDIPQLFSAENGSYDIDFDLLAAVFYCLSRYEEYLPFSPDEHGRFCSTQSWAAHVDLVQIPVVEMWMNYLKEAIKAKYPRIVFKEHVFQIRPTIDIDTAWAYSERPLWAQFTRLAKALVTFDFPRSHTILRAITQQEDPFDTFSLFSDLLCDKESVFFWLMRDELPFDTAYYVDHPAYRKLIKKVSTHAEIGLHPSYTSYQKQDALQSEKDTLALLADKDIIKSRQHYLRFSLPLTYQHLIAVGIKEDYSMGYADTLGFRAGTCFPFYFYDLEREESTDLLVHPFQAMDVTLRDYLSLVPDQACSKISSLKQTIQSFEGQFCFIWHNSSFYESDGWSGWDKVLLECLKTE